MKETDTTVKGMNDSQTLRLLGKYIHPSRSEIRPETRLQEHHHKGRRWWDIRVIVEDVTIWRIVGSIE